MAALWSNKAAKKYTIMIDTIYELSVSETYNYIIICVLFLHHPLIHTIINTSSIHKCITTQSSVLSMLKIYLSNAGVY